MSLLSTINATPTYELDLPSNGQKIIYKPFLVKQEKILLSALESNKDKEIALALKQVISECIAEPKDFDIESLPIFDVEYIFLKIRGKSVGEKVTLKLRCPDDEKVVVDYELDLDKVDVLVDDDHNLEVKLEDRYGVHMRYPTISSLKLVSGNSVDTALGLIKECIDVIYKDDKEFKRKDITDKELSEWIDNLTQKQFTQFETFFKGMPRLEHLVKFKNPNSGKEHSIKLVGLKSFFQ
jgi:hypothetical protein